MANKSKMVIVVFRRVHKLNKEQSLSQSAITAIMAMMSIGGIVGPDSKLVFELRDEPGGRGLPRGWFIGDSQFAIEVKRIMAQESYHTLYEWCKREGVPVFSGECDGESSLMVIGPYWENIIDELFVRAVPLEKDLRPFTTVIQEDEEKDTESAQKKKK